MNSQDLVTTSRPAGLYMYTTDSRFNSEFMTPYMADGIKIMPPDAPELLGSVSVNSTFAGSNLDLFNLSSSTSSAPNLDMLSVS